MQLGEVDAGVVYVTDVKAAGDKVKGIEIAGDVNASTTYPIAALTAAPNPAAAAAFVAYVMSAEGKAVLTAGGSPHPSLGAVTATNGRRRRPGHVDALWTVGVPAAAPWPLAVLATIAVLFLLVPLAAMLLRAPWSSLPRILEQSGPRGAAALAAVRIGRHSDLARGRRSPGLGARARPVPRPVPAPCACDARSAAAGGRRCRAAAGVRSAGVVGRYLDLWFGFTLPFTTLAVIVAEAFVAMPFLVVTVEGRSEAWTAGTRRPRPPSGHRG